MANILPEVQPIVTSMPSKGYEMQTGGSARRSFIKNNSNTYFIHGVPGHTHNASAMISVTADYSRKRGVLETINTSWRTRPSPLRPQSTPTATCRATLTSAPIGRSSGALAESP